MNHRKMLLGLALIVPARFCTRDPVIMDVVVWDVEDSSLVAHARHLHSE